MLRLQGVWIFRENTVMQAYKTTTAYERYSFITLQFLNP